MTETELSAETTEVALETTETEVETPKVVDPYSIENINNPVLMEDGTTLPWCMVNYTIPTDPKTGKLKIPYRKYMSEAKCWNTYYPNEPGEAFKRNFLKKHWLAKYPDRDPKEFNSKKLSTEDAEVIYADPRWGEVRKEFLYEHALGAARAAYFEANYPDDNARCKKEKEEEKLRKEKKRKEKEEKAAREGKKSKKRSRSQSEGEDEEEEEEDEDSAPKAAKLLASLSTTSASTELVDYKTRCKMMVEIEKKMRMTNEALIDTIRGIFV